MGSGIPRRRGSSGDLWRPREGPAARCGGGGGEARWTRSRGDKGGGLKSCGGGSALLNGHGGEQRKGGRAVESGVGQTV
jgi:hypothetical protein